MAQKITYPQSKIKTIHTPRPHIKRCLRVTDSRGSVTHYSGIRALYDAHSSELDCSKTVLYSLLQYTKGSAVVGSLSIERVNVDANVINIIGIKTQTITARQ
jgi:hypothetical protein